MLLAEEFLLLNTDDTTGRKEIGGESLEPALGAALLVELVLRERIRIEPKEAGRHKRGRVEVLNPAPTDDAELDALLTNLARRPQDKLSDLISPMSGKRITKGLADRLLHRLVADGVLALKENKLFGLIPSRSFPTRDPEPEGSIRRQLQSALVGGETPTERTTALIALLNATNRITKIVDAPDKRALRARAKELSEGDWAAKAVKDAIDETWAVMATIGATAGVAGS